MKNFKLKISSKNEKVIAHFCEHLFKRKNIKHNFKSIKKYKNLVKKTKVVTLLKAPHVYKTAQEQFEYKILKKKIKLLVTNYKKFLILLKKIKAVRFFEINIQLMFNIQKYYSAFLKKHFFESLNFIFVNIFIYNKKNQNKLFFILKNKKKNFDPEIRISAKFLKILDVFGEKILVSKSIY